MAKKEPVFMICRELIMNANCVLTLQNDGKLTATNEDPMLLSMSLEIAENLCKLISAGWDGPKYFPELAVNQLGLGKKDDAIRKAMSMMGSVRSPAKARASRENGKLGGRPRKIQPETVPPKRDKT